MDRGLLLLLTLTTTVGVKGEDGGADTPLWPDVVPVVPAGANGEEALEIATAAECAHRRPLGTLCLTLVPS